MKKNMKILALISFLLLVGCQFTFWRNIKIEWLGSSHPYGGACVRLSTLSKTIYFDPAYIGENHYDKPADLIFITHPHDDHCSEAIVAQLVHEDTTIVTIEECAELLGPSLYNLVVVKPGDMLEVEGVEVEEVPAYNLVSGAHPKENGWVGFVIHFDGSRFYHSGDTSFVPEMAALENIDVAFMTVRDYYMMNGVEVVQAAKAFKPKVIIPVHWLVEYEQSEIDYIVEHTPKHTDVRVLKQI